MYLPESFRETDPAALHALIRAYPLGTWVSRDADGLTADHIPFLLDSGRGPLGTLACHVARANPVWRRYVDGAEALVVFQGEQAYITPSWYPGKAEHGKVVPTWNYVVAHVHGRPQVIDDRDWLLRHLDALTDAHEAGRARPWRLADAPAAFIDRLLEHIVGVEIPIERLTGKSKASQNRPEADRHGVATGLREEGGELARAMAERVGG